MSDIVVGIDAAPGARDALVFATRLADCTGGSVRLVNAFNYSDAPSRASNETFRRYLEDDARELLAAVAGSADSGVSGAEAIADPSPPHALHQLAESADVALLVVGSTHRGPIGRVLPGSTGERLVHGAPCPVAIVPRGYADADPIRTIGVGYDASDESKAAVEAACLLARGCGARLRIIHVFDASHGSPALMTMPGWDSMQDEAKARQRKSLMEAVGSVPADLGVESAFLTGAAGPQLAEESAEVDLMVVGSRGYGPRAALLLGGVGHTLIREARCPVVVLPRGSRGLDALFASAAEATAS